MIEDKDELNLSPFTFTPRTPSMEQDSSMTQMTKTFSTPKVSKASMNNNSVTPTHKN